MIFSLFLSSLSFDYSTGGGGGGGEGGGGGLGSCSRLDREEGGGGGVGGVEEHFVSKFPPNKKY